MGNEVDVLIVIDDNKIKRVLTGKGRKEVCRLLYLPLGETCTGEGLFY
jgi:predicted nucleotidyltransferase